MRLPRRKKDTVRVVFDIPIPKGDTLGSNKKLLYFQVDEGQYHTKTNYDYLTECGRTVAVRVIDHHIEAKFTKKVKVG